ncbi:hypothetical protein G647_10136 [Cladophialophora carrionii CBS 160.54]|uniref:GA4 desaturase family protein n=1 Tax=Cladophialophora carrionii CBS 160.54 TaxID=1279043 RepID=V9DM52_9EURO|nr:uncharacterized protein G647_10136 [Cladophialophora carrionii CBS 160.54]ETI27037.1 hypothetical protein G647_10136 [Cladophialophora carrionii CBS 160.54]
MAIKDSIFVDGTSAHVVSTTLRYWLDPSPAGYKAFYAGTAGVYRRKHDEQPAQITDVRGREKEFTLDKQGFAFVQHESKEKDFADDEGIKDRLYPEVSELLKDVTAATHVRPFSHLVRSERWEDAQAAWEGKKDDEIVHTKVPARFAHVDHSYAGAMQILNDNLTDEAERARLTANTRWAIINVWRPIHHPVTRDALTVCDARTVDESDLEGLTAKLPAPQNDTYGTVSLGRAFETWAVKANPAHRWYYKSGMTPDEALLLKIFDSKKDGRARRVPHTSFQCEEDYGAPRHSVEIRCLVFWEDQSLE